MAPAFAAQKTVRCQRGRAPLGSRGWEWYRYPMLMARLFSALLLATALTSCATAPSTIEAEVAAGTVAAWGLFGLVAAALSFG